MIEDKRNISQYLQEIWKDIPNYSGDYKVSNLGRVKTMKYGRNKLMKQSITGKGYKIGKGYLAVRLSFNSTSKLFKVHQLVALAFLNHAPDKTQEFVVDHINNISTDNRLENLRVITNRENVNQSHIKTSSKYTGVCYFKRDNNWISYININGKRKHLGYFKTEIEAHLQYQKELSKIC